MALIRLTNERWGFSSNCYVCEPTNDVGLGLEFFHDDERNVVTSQIELSNDFSGAPNYVHGGVVKAILDEIESWATIAIAGKFAVTTKTTVEFPKPVRVGKTYTAEAEIVSAGRETIEVTGRILDHKGEVCAHSVSTLYVLSAAVAADAIGDVGGDDAAFLRDESSS